jgi:hypothetical protein
MPRILASAGVKPDSPDMRTNHTVKGRARRTQAAPTAVGPEASDMKPTVIVAPGVLGDGAIVVRHPDDTDSEYQARCDLFALLLEHAEKD